MNASSELSPPRPHPELPAGSIWPGERGRAILREIAALEPERMTSLVGQLGRAVGSGSHDLILERAGEWCLKTSPRRRFEDEDGARLAALGIVQRKLYLEELLPHDSALAMVDDPSGGSWIWTLSPWMTTLRVALERAEERADEKQIAYNLSAYAEVIVRALALASDKQIQLDVHPSNFGWGSGSLRYLDDDLGRGSRLPAIGHAILQRIEEYAAWPRATGAYVDLLVELLPARVNAMAIERTGLRATLEAEPTRSAAAAEARRRLLKAAWRCR
jgi:hypothetical protein